jgi:hypothetical protein
MACYFCTYRYLTDIDGIEVRTNLTGNCDAAIQRYLFL